MSIHVETILELRNDLCNKSTNIKNRNDYPNKVDKARVEELEEIRTRLDLIIVDHNL